LFSIPVYLLEPHHFYFLEVFLASNKLDIPPSSPPLFFLVDLDISRIFFLSLPAVTFGFHPNRWDFVFNPNPCFFPLFVTWGLFLFFLFPVFT